MECSPLQLQLVARIGEALLHVVFFLPASHRPFETRYVGKRSRRRVSAYQREGPGQIVSASFRERHPVLVGV